MISSRVAAETIKAALISGNTDTEEIILERINSEEFIVVTKKEWDGLSRAVQSLQQNNQGKGKHSGHKQVN